MFRVIKRLKALKGELRKFKKQFLDIENEASLALTRLVCGYTVADFFESYGCRAA